MKKNDLLLAAVLLTVALICGIGYYALHRSPAIRAEVTVDGVLTETLDLSKDQEITIESADGQSNHLIVKDGAIWCSEASCPDKLCVNQGKQDREGSVIVCLPNRMIVQIIGP